jgi:hypothetical protein
MGIATEEGFETLRNKDRSWARSNTTKFLYGVDSAYRSHQYATTMCEAPENGWLHEGKGHFALVPDSEGSHGTLLFWSNNQVWVIADNVDLQQKWYPFALIETVSQGTVAFVPSSPNALQALQAHSQVQAVERFRIEAN